MTKIGAYEAKTHLPRILDQVELGETVTITKHGREVARLIPVQAQPAPASEIVAALREGRRGVRLGRMSVRRMIDEGRR